MSEDTYEGRMPIIDDFCNQEPQEEMFPGFPCFLFTPEQLQQKKSRQLMKCRCTECGREFTIPKNQIQARINAHKPNAFCSQQCSQNFTKRTCSKPRKAYVCKLCGKIVEPDEYYGSGQFCSQSCVARHNGRLANSSEARQKKSRTLRKPRLPKEVFIELQEKWNLKDIRIKLNLSHQQFREYVKMYDLKDNPIFIDGKRIQVVNVCRKLLDKPFEKGSITYDELKIVQDECHRLMFEEGWSSSRVCTDYLKMKKAAPRFIYVCLEVPLRSLYLANYMVLERKGYYDDIEDEKLYRSQCQFKFSSTLYPYLLGHELLLSKRGWYHPQKNPYGVTRDHMISIDYGYRHNRIDPYLISHPANCMFMLHVENSITKRAKCSITLEELIDRVEWFNETILYRESNTNLKHDIILRYSPALKFSKQELQKFKMLSMI